MAISMSKYVSIVSGVGGEATVARKDMILRILTTNPLAPFDKVLEFSGDAAKALKAVGGYFGTLSTEYKMASKYFGWVSKKITTATKISFARYAPTAIEPTIIPTIAVPSLSAFTSITDGGMTVNMDGASYEITGLDFSAATSLTDVAGIIQTAVRGNTSGGAIWTAATVSFVANYGFELTGGVAGAAVISTATAPTAGTDISGLVGWDIASSPIVSNGANLETITAALDRTSNISNNYASFTFKETLTSDEIVEAATWAKNQNYSYVYVVGCEDSDYVSLSASLADKNCVALTYDNQASYAELIPAIIGAATPYERVNGVMNYMFTQFSDIEPSVTTDAKADVLDPLRINYMGQTQKAGKLVSFYQDGFDMAGTQLNVVYGEIYLKDVITTACLNLLLGVGNVPASERGDAMFRSVVIPELEAAKANGIISTAKPLNNTQKAYIDEQTGEEDSWRELQNNGYILISGVEIFDTNRYKWNYILLYSKGDAIIKVTGSDIMI